MVTNSGKFRRIAAHYVYTRQGFLKNGIITTDADGAIISVDTDKRPDACSGVEFYNGILIPGLVNAHTHLELSCMRGVIPEGGGFAAFAAGMRSNRGRFTDEQRREAAEFYDAQMWADGVSVVGDICNSGETFGIKQRSRIFYHSFIEVFGLDKDSVSEAESLRNQAVGLGLVATITPHSTYSLNNKKFATAIGGRDNTPLSLHFMESPAEAELFCGKGELQRWYDKSGMVTDFTKTYSSPTDRITKEIPKKRDLLLVHNTCVGAAEIERIKIKYGDRATWVLCLASNNYMNRLTPPVELIRDSGMRVAVGTDSLASNHELSVIDELKMIKGVPLEEIIGWATLGGAQALGVSDRYGSFEQGKCPGVVQLTGVDMDNMTLTADATTRRLI